MALEGQIGVGIAIGLAPIALPYLLFGWLERRYPAGPLQDAARWWLNLRIGALYLAVPSLIGGGVAGLVALVRRHNGGGVIDLDLAGGSVAAGAAACLAFVLVWDFFYYWWHRAQHRVPALWRLHKLHHMDDRLGVSTEMRLHWLEEIGRLPVIVLPMALLFNLPVHAGAAAVTITAWSAFIHANLRLELRSFGAVVAGPQLHRIHHSILPEHRDRNFAAFFPLWDVLFGSYWHPRRGEFPATGVEGEAEVRTVWASAVLPFRAAGSDAAATARQRPAALGPEEVSRG